MMTIRSRFYKKGDMVFISHLDLLRVFERAIRRADLPIDFTNGFNPRQIIAFATALSVGVSSDSEYVDIQLKEMMDLNEFFDRLNKELPEGLKLMKSVVIGSNEDSLMKIITSSTYLVKASTKENIEEKDLKNKIEEFLALDKIIDLKKKKDKKGRGNRNKKPEFVENNIRPWINSIEIFSVDGNHILFKMHLSAGNERNLRPEIALHKLNELKEISLDLDTIRIHRLELFREINGENKTLLDGIDSMK